MIVRIFTVGPFVMNAYLVGDRNGGRAVLVDPGGGVDEMLAAAGRLSLEVEAVWLTHAHLDHVAGVAEAVERTGVPVFLHPDDRPLYDAAARQAEAFGVELDEPPAPDRELADGQQLELGELRVEVIHVPGHSPGHVAFWVPDARAVFAGDCIFAGSIGRTDLPGGSHPTLMSSIEDRLFSLGDDVRIYPGHGPPTSVAEERQTNPFFGGADRGRVH